MLAVGIAFMVARATRSPDGDGRGGGTTASGFARKLSQLTFAEGVEEWPAWSPDGKRLAYVAEDGGYRQLFLQDSGGASRRLTSGRHDDIQPAWSPDGRRLAFVRAKTARGKLEPADINGSYRDGGDIWVLDLAAETESRLVEDASITLPLLGRNLDAEGIVADPDLSAQLRGALETFAAAIGHG